jgi:translation initiation factor 3 subunit C
MSRFWAGADSDDSSSGSDDSYSSEDEVQRGRGVNQWVDLSESEDSEDEGRVVMSAKDRAMETFNLHIKNLRSHMKQKDYKKILSEFDELSKAMVKAKKILAAGVPRQLVRILVDLEDFINDRSADKEEYKKLTPNQGRALNKMKLTIKKHNKPYQVVIEHYRKNPVTDDDDKEDDDDASSSGSSSSSSSSSSDSVSDDKHKKKKDASEKDSVS